MDLKNQFLKMLIFCNLYIECVPIKIQMRFLSSQVDSNMYKIEQRTRERQDNFEEEHQHMRVHWLHHIAGLIYGFIK